MYNGIGLASVRGSGTSGYVQQNKFALRPRRQDALGPRDDRLKPRGSREPNAEILEHERKRRVELEVERRRVELEDAGEPDEAIEDELDRYRKELRERAAAVEAASAAREGRGREGDPPGGRARGRDAADVHLLAARKQEQVERLRGALGIREDHREGEAFDRDLQEARKRQRLEDREARRPLALREPLTPREPLTFGQPIAFGQPLPSPPPPLALGQPFAFGQPLPSPPPPLALGQPFAFGQPLPSPPPPLALGQPLPSPPPPLALG